MKTATSAWLALPISHSRGFVDSVRKSNLVAVDQLGKEKAKAASAVHEHEGGNAHDGKGAQGLGTPWRALWKWSLIQW